jgi:hypothetical protein
MRLEDKVVVADIDAATAEKLAASLPDAIADVAAIALRNRRTAQTSSHGPNRPGRRADDANAPCCGSQA